jgi:hypothetical protein
MQLVGIKHIKSKFILNKENEWEWTLSGSGQGKTKVFLKTEMNCGLQKVPEISLVDEKLLPSVERRLLSVVVDVCYLLFSPLQVSKLPVS